MEIEVLMNMTDSCGQNLQLFRSDDDGEITYVISADFVDVKIIGGGCYWCTTSATLAEARAKLAQIIEHLDANNGVFDAYFLMETFGMETC